MNYEKWMRKAIELAKIGVAEGELAVGAVIVKDGVCVAEAYNQVAQLGLVEGAHAQCLAIAQARINLKTRFLVDCDMYCTHEPCLICCNAIALARLRGVYYGVSKPIGPIGSVFPGAMKGNVPTIVGGILEHECRALCQTHFEMMARNYGNTPPKKTACVMDACHPLDERE